MATIEEAKYFCEKMFKLIKSSTAWGDDQAAINYLIYENQLEIENVIESSCHDGNILTAGLFGVDNPLKLQGEKFLRGDGGVPAAVHQYNWHNKCTDIVNKIYRAKEFQFDENFLDTKSMLDQVFYLVNSERVSEAHKLFTWYLLGADLKGYDNDLIKIFEVVLSKDSTLAAELLSLSIQGTLPLITFQLNLQLTEKIRLVTNNLMTSRRLVIPQFKIFVKDITFFMAGRLCEVKQFEQSIAYLNFITTLNVPLDANFYLLQARIYRETGRKAEALAAYEKALNV